MEKIQKKLIDLVGNGYGINQAMAKLELDEKAVVKLMEEDLELNEKLKKRFKNIKWLNVPYKGVVNELPTGDTPELAALKAEAKELGIEFNPQIGYNKLKQRVDEFKARQAEGANAPTEVVE